MRRMTSRQKLFRALALAAAVSALSLSLSACGVSRIAIRGNQPDPERIAELKPGEVSKDDILDSIGSPSSINTFGKETWYYISERTETVAFLAPKVLERKVLIVEFNDKGMMSQIVELGLDAGRELTHVKRITPTFGEELTVIEQILGNFRRFAGKKK
jgi:outer membrane protein assembly factor BamE (lipoprotein component of BamABCDE complex)